MEGFEPSIVGRVHDLRTGNIARLSLVTFDECDTAKNVRCCTVPDSCGLGGRGSVRDAEFGNARPWLLSILSTTEKVKMRIENRKFEKLRLPAGRGVTMPHQRLSAATSHREHQQPAKSCEGHCVWFRDNVWVSRVGQPLGAEEITPNLKVLLGHVAGSRITG